jgi:hypothetical protein
VHEIENAMEQDIRTASWMTQPTKQQALAKLATVANKIGYPDKWRDYSTVAIRRDEVSRLRYESLLRNPCKSQSNRSALSGCRPYRLPFFEASDQFVFRAISVQGDSGRCVRHAGGCFCLHKFPVIGDAVNGARKRIRGGKAQPVTIHECGAQSRFFLVRHWKLFLRRHYCSMVPVNIEEPDKLRSASTIKQHLVCIRMLFGWLMMGHG